MNKPTRKEGVTLPDHILAHGPDDPYRRGFEHGVNRSRARIESLLTMLFEAEMERERWAQKYKTLRTQIRKENLAN